MESTIIIDYLTVSLECDNFADLVKLLGLENSRLNWQPCPGRNFYKSGMTYANEISLFLDNFSSQNSACINITGRGCRDIEAFSRFSLKQLVTRLHFFGCQFSRIDLACDIHDKSFTIDKLVKEYEKENFTCRSNSNSIIKGVKDGIKGTSLYFGRQSSNTYINIYDKRAERGFKPDELDPWCRVEIRLRHENCEPVIRALIEHEIGSVYNSVLSHFLIFRKPNKNDVNKSRWEVASYWKMFLKNVIEIKSIEEVGVEYDYSKFEKYLFTTCGSSIKTYLQNHTTDELKQNLQSIELNARQQMLVDNYKDGIDFMYILGDDF